MTRDQIFRPVYYLRNQSGDNIRLVESFPTNMLSSEDERLFLRFSSLRNLPNSRGDLEPVRMIGWAHPDLVFLLKYKNLSCLVDGTFRCVPRPFSQLLILMVYDSGHDVYVPVFFILLDSKMEISYRLLFNEVKESIGQSLNIDKIHVDFEKGLINSIKSQFPKSKIIGRPFKEFFFTLLGCLFHWKQAIRRKLTNLRIPKEEIVFAMNPGVLDILTIIPEDEILSIGIPYTQYILK